MRKCQLPILVFIIYHTQILEGVGRVERFEKYEKEIEACVAKYMEKDYLSIKSIIFPEAHDERGSCRKRDEGRGMREDTTLVSTCGHLRSLNKCFTNELIHVRAIEDFFNLRHVWYTFGHIITWLCGKQDFQDIVTATDTEQIHNRFSVLLESIECLECVRQLEESPCFHQRLASSRLWEQMAILIVGHEVCDELEIQNDCYRKTQYIRQSCGDKSEEIHKNISDYFATLWCQDNNFFDDSINTSTSTINQFSLSAINLLNLFVILSLFHQYANFENIAALNLNE